jgi:hypothetical protein
MQFKPVSTRNWAVATNKPSTKTPIREVIPRCGHLLYEQKEKHTPKCPGLKTPPGQKRSLVLSAFDRRKRWWAMVNNSERGLRRCNDIFF